MPHPSNFWTDDRIERLKIMHAAEWSLSAMAAELGTTRGAISGKIDRLKLPRSKNENGGLSDEARAPVLPPLPDISAADKKPMAAGGPVTIFELTSRTCRYPLGSTMQRAEFFCGCLPTENLPYCAEHARKAYHPVNSRQREER